MEQQQNNYTAEDIMRYHNGSLSAQEMHRMEKAALDDPFLADALEGYVHTADPVGDVAELRSLLKRRTGRKLFTLPLNQALKVAALLVMIAGFSWIAYQYTVDSNSIAMEKEATQPMREETGATATDTANTNIVAPEEEDEALLVQTPVRNQKRKVAAAQPAPPATSTVSDSNAGSETEKVETVAAPQARVAAPVSASANQDMVLQKATPPYQHRITGRVVDENNIAVPHATVQVLNNKLSVQAASDGTFSIPVPDTAVKVSVHSVGFEENRAFLSNSAENKVVLQHAENALNEVVVTGYGKAARRAEAEARIKLDGATAVGGAMAYERYVVETLKPFSSQHARVNGAVELEFDIDATGKPVDIKVERSLCGPCDAEAIRVISEGPKLRKTKKNSRARVRILF